MVDYDASIIHTFADTLYAQARRVVIVWTLMGFIVAAVLLGLIASAGNLRGIRMPEMLIAGCFGAIIGFFMGRARAFGLKLRAQVALCQVLIEKHTRHAGQASQQIAA